MLETLLDLSFHANRSPRKHSNTPQPPLSEHLRLNLEHIKFFYYFHARRVMMCHLQTKTSKMSDGSFTKKKNSKFDVSFVNISVSDA